ncbi:MAG TPA: sigma factor-like helix-turn-helix DNA-binding protein [Ktedonobacteraceae bacterium]|nr:sigma factor-like helix-turn-helix DNA-binding protein [Ktedonobacteraceae bacterium]
MEYRQEQYNPHASLMAQDQYLREVRWFEKLTRQEEEVLVQRIVRAKAERKKEKPDQWVLSLAKHARSELVENYQGLVSSLARRYVRWCQSMDFLDLVQEGNVALVRAIDEAEFTTGKQLCAVVVVRVKGAIRNAIRDRDGLVRMAAWVYEALQKICSAKRDLETRLGHEPSLIEIAQKLGMTQERVLEVTELGFRAQQVGSIQQLLLEDQEEDCVNFVSLFQEACVADRERSQELENILQEALTCLTEKQREVVGLRYGLGEHAGCEYALSDVAGMLGKHPESVRKTEAKAKQKLCQVIDIASMYGQEELSA